MNHINWGYARVSSKDQNEDRQIIELKNQGIDDRRIIVDKQSGKSFDRTGYQSLKNAMLRKGDSLTVTALDRFGRNKEEIKNELKALDELGVRVKIINIPTTMIDFPEGQEWVLKMVQNILIEVLSTIAEQELHTIKKRQRAGIEAAKQRNVKFGRPTKEPDNWNQIYFDWKCEKITATSAIQKMDISSPTFYRWVNAEK